LLMHPMVDNAAHPRGSATRWRMAGQVGPHVRLLMLLTSPLPPRDACASSPKSSQFHRTGKISKGSSSNGWMDRRLILTISFVRCAVRHNVTHVDRARRDAEANKVLARSVEHRSKGRNALTGYRAQADLTNCQLSETARQRSL
jgi:hypothetical protein